MTLVLAGESALVAEESLVFVGVTLPGVSPQLQLVPLELAVLAAELGCAVRLLLRPSVLHSHWSSSNEALLSLVESFRVLLRQQCPKEPARRIQTPYYGLWNAKRPKGSFLACPSLVLYGMRIVGFHALKGPIIGCP